MFIIITRTMKGGYCMSRVIQVSFTDKEFADLERFAQEEGVTISHFIKGKVLEDTEFQRWFHELLLRVGRIPKDTAFNIKAVFGTDWISISKGVRLALGRSFYNYVNAGKVPGIMPTEKDSASTQWYRRVA